MTGDDPRDSARDNDSLLYDYSKHLLSLSLLGIGGIVSLTQSPQGQRIEHRLVAALICLFAAAGFCALTGTATILRAHRRGVATPPGAWWSSQGAMMFLGMGVGGFLIAWIGALV